MTLDSRVGIFTTAMRAEFQNAFEASAEPAPYEAFTEIVASTARIENYTWMGPSPGIAEWVGHRRYGHLDAIKYIVENKEFDAAFEVLLRDIEDDQTGGYLRKPKELALRAKLFPGRYVVKNLALGASLSCFDGSSFFANSHNIGTGDNTIAYTSSGSSDSATLKLACLYAGGPLKPMLWQNRKPPKFMDTSGTPASSEIKTVKYWIDLEGNFAFGYWHDAILVTITNTPDVSDFQEILRQVMTRFRSFQLPKSASSEDGEYIHEQTRFTGANFQLVGSTALEIIADQSLNQDWVPQNIGSNTVATTNVMKGKATFTPSAFFD